MLRYQRDRTQTPKSGWHVQLPWPQHPRQKGKRTAGRVGSFLPDSHLLIGAPGFGNLIFALVLEEERSLPIGTITRLGALLMLIQPGRELEQRVRSFSKKSAEFGLFVFFFKETNFLL